MTDMTRPARAVSTASAQSLPPSLFWVGAALALLALGIYWLSPAPTLGLFLLEPVAIGALALGLIALGAARVLSWTNVIFGLVILTCVWRILVDALSHYTPIFDDAFMFVRYVQNLFAEGRLAWNPGGPATYGMTTPLYAAVVAGVMLLLPNADPTRIISLASLFSGAAFLAAAFALLWRTLPADSPRRQIVIGFIFVILASASGALSLHFVSGMDTTFALFMLTCYFIAAHRHITHPTWGATAAAAALGALLFWTRPELTLYAAAIPLGMFALAADAHMRRQAFRLGVLTLAGLLAILAVNTLYFGVPLPLPFYIKSGGLYDEPNLVEALAAAPSVMLFGFVMTYGLLLLPTVAAVIAGGLGFLRRSAWLVGVTTLTTGVLVLYYLLVVLQVMFFMMRFYHHLLPALIWLAGLSLVYWSERLNVPLMRQLWGKYSRIFIAMALASSAALPIAWLLSTANLPDTNVGWMRYTSSLTEDGISERRFERARASQQLMYTQRAAHIDQALWFGLSALAEIDSPLVIATTEVGRPSVLNRRFTIIDLAGLNNTDIVFNGFSADRLLTIDQPDWIYVPHDDYARTTEAILTHPQFAQRYDYYPAEALGYILGVAIRRDSPEYARLTAIMQAAGAQPAAPPPSPTT